MHGGLHLLSALPKGWRRPSGVALFVAVLVLSQALVWGDPARAQEKGPAKPAAAAAKPPTTVPAKQPAAPVVNAAPAPASPAAPAAASPAAGQLPGEVKPELIYLPDKQGNLLPVPNFTLEDLQALLKLKNNVDQQDQRPRYSVKRISIAGQAALERAELAVETTIVVQDAQWVRVPLRLGSAMMQQESKYQGTGEHFLVREEGADGYVCWLRGEPGSEHQLTLNLLAPLIPIGGERSLKLTVPRAAAFSQLKLIVDTDAAIGRVSEPSELVSTKAAGTGKTEFAVMGLGGEFELAWRSAAAQVARVPTVLEASGSILARVDGRSVKTEAKLAVRSFGGPFDQFRLRLPPGAVLIGPNQSGVAVNETAQQPADAETHGKVIDVKLDKKSAGPVEINFVTERPYDVAQTDELLELAGFEVIGAVRQWGHIAVRVQGNWQVSWGPNRNVRQVDDLPGAATEDLAAAFEYFVQPCSLTARVVPQKTRISVTPEYQFVVGAQQVDLEAQLKYTVRGAKIRRLSIDLPGWEIDSLGPPNLVDMNADDSNEEPSFSIPLAHPSSGEFTIKVTAHRALPPDAKSLELDIPRAEADAPGQAVVTMLAADNVELSPQTDKLVGLSVHTPRARSQFISQQQDPLYYRTEASAARFVAAIKVHPQSISTEVASQVELTEQDVRVSQRLTYQVAYEPIDRLAILVPKAIALDKLKITLDGQELVPVAQGEATGSGALAVLPMRVGLPKPRIGRCELQVRYSLLQDKLLPATSNSLSVPLVMPADERLGQNTLRVTDKAGLTVTLRKGGWAIDDKSPRAPSRGELALIAKGPQTELPLALTLKERLAVGSTVIERGWVQTWLTDKQRQDRVVYRFTTNDPRIRLTLPTGIAVTDVEATLDGVRVASETDSDGDLSIPLAAGSNNRPHLLELNYAFKGRSRSGQMTFAAPQFKPSVWIRRMYWQLVLPANEHVVLGPSSSFLTEFNWNWNGLAWRRQPTLDQEDLEKWMQTPAAPALSGNANRYLFSTVAACGTLDVWTARRTLIVFSSSLILLVTGLSLIYFPKLRHPALLLVFAALVIAGSIIEPETSVLLAQGASLGLVLVLVALWLARKSLKRAAPVVVTKHGSSYSNKKDSGTELYFRSAKGSSPSTATAPMVVQSAQADEES